MSLKPKWMKKRQIMKWISLLLRFFLLKKLTKAINSLLLRLFEDVVGHLKTGKSLTWKSSHLWKRRDKMIQAIFKGNTAFILFHYLWEKCFIHTKLMYRTQIWNKIIRMMGMILAQKMDGASRYDICECNSSYFLKLIFLYLFTTFSFFYAAENANAYNF